MKGLMIKEEVTGVCYWLKNIYILYTLITIISDGDV